MSLYKTLDPSKREVRVLMIRARTTSEPITDSIMCTLDTISLDDPPPYVALSYAWGVDMSPKPIMMMARIGEYGVAHPTKIHQNLYDALLRFRKDNSHIRMWVDAICINQTDPVEKAHQVQQMRNIYESALHVSVWLGLATDETRKAMACMLKLANQMREFVELDNQTFEDAVCIKSS